MSRTSPETATLLPCPFCGSEAKKSASGETCKIHCSNEDGCTATTRSWWNEQNATAAWNRRAGVAPTAKEQKYIRVGWFNPYNDYHGFQQVHRSYEGGEGTFPLFCRESDLGKTDLPGATVSQSSAVHTREGE